MERVNRILRHKKFKKAMKKNKRAEEGRSFCKHDLDHLLDVARIGYLICMENRIGYKKDVVYAAALLHDIGRYKQIKKGIPHHEAGKVMAPEILEDCGFTEEETEMITEAIYRHRDLKEEETKSLNYILYRADKLSRKCYECSAKDRCNWPDAKKNYEIVY
jgi:uncharacterized protein